MSLQNEGEEHRDDGNPPPAGAQEETQHHYTDMALVLDQNFHHGLESVFGFGDYQYEAPSPDLGTPPNGPPVLTHSDQSVLSSFFSDPNGITSNLVPFDTGLPQGQETMSGFAYDFANGTINPSATGRSGQGSLHKNNHNHNGRNITFGHTENWQQPQQHMNADDMSAASAIHNLKTPTPALNYSNIPIGGIGASWGNFGMPNPMPNSDLSNNVPTVPGQPQLRAVAVPFQARHHSFGYPTQAPFEHYQANGPSQSETAQGQPPRSRHMSYGDHSAPSQAPQLPSAQQAHAMSFGTDTSFSGNRYQGSHINHEDKVGNLLGVYGVASAQRPRPMPPSSDQKPNGLPFADRVRSPLDAADTSQWSGMNNQAESAGGAKRRRSQVDDAGGSSSLQQGGHRAGDGWENDLESHKRRKSTTATVLTEMADAESAEDKRKKKMRETLTDAEKRQHHIMSEKKRRELINTGFTDLQNMVPCLQAGKSGLSRSEVLQEIASYLETLKEGNIKLTAELRKNGLDTTPSHIKTENGAVGQIYGT